MGRGDVSALCHVSHGIDPIGTSRTALACLPLCCYVSLCLTKLVWEGERPFPCRDSEPLSCTYLLSELGTEEIDKPLAELLDSVTVFLSRLHYANEADKGPQGLPVLMQRPLARAHTHTHQLDHSATPHAARLLSAHSKSRLHCSNSSS